MNVTHEKRCSAYSSEPGLHPISSSTQGLGSDPRVVSWMVEQHMWLVERMIERIAAVWPESIDHAWLTAHGTAALRHAVLCANKVEDLQTLSVKAIGDRLRQLLIGTAWYREAMLERARPLCEARHGAIMAGREAADGILCSKLHLSPDDLTERFIEFATVFAAEPAALLPCQRDEGWGAHEITLQLPNDQQLVCSLYFERQLTLTEIARVMGQDERRVQELFGRAAVALVVDSMLSRWGN
jgi:hypothetical protein